MPRPSRSLRRVWSQAARWRLVGIDVAGEAARDRPDAAGIERLQQRRMRHQPRDAAVAVKERVNPGEAMMRGGGAEDGVGFAEAAVDLPRSAQESAVWRRRADRDMPADRDIARGAARPG